MIKPWWNRKREDDEFEDWQYTFDEPKPEMSQWKKAAAAALIFAVAYGLHASQTTAGNFVKQGIVFTVNQNIDFAYLAEQARAYAPLSFDDRLLERVREAVARPADPLQYMSAPVEGRIETVFGVQTDPKTEKEVLFEGIEYQCEIGTEVKASSLGKVKKISADQKIGRYIILEHGRDVETVYGYLSEVLVEEGDRISQGQAIAKSGKRPDSLAPLLYFELREKNTPVDPESRIQGKLPSGGGKA